MAKLLERHASNDPNRIALIDSDGAIGWGEFNDRVNRLINGLRSLGLGPGDLISIYAGNGRAYYELMAAAGHAGIIVRAGELALHARGTRLRRRQFRIETADHRHDVRSQPPRRPSRAAKRPV